MNDETVSTRFTPLIGDSINVENEVHSSISPPRRLRILWVKMGGLWPANSGGRLRSYHMINELSRDNELTLLTTHGVGESASELRAHLPLCKRVDSRPFSPPKSSSKTFLLSLLASWFSRLPVDLYKYQFPELRREVERILPSGEFDLCIADFMSAVPNVPMTGNTPVVFFSHNVEYMIWRRLYDHEPSWIKRALLSIEWRKMRRAEAQACDSALTTIAVSAEDAQELRLNSPQAHISSVHTGVDVDYFKKDVKVVENPFALVFTGSMDWLPNEDAMLYFMDEILPRIRQRFPQTTLTIVGRNPSLRLKVKAQVSGVEVSGTVPDIRPWTVRAAVYIVPLRIGGGTRLKIYEALAMGMAVVSTTIGAEGLDLHEGVHLLRADSADTFAERVIDLLEHPEQRKALGSAGRKLMEDNYAWSRIADQFKNLCCDAMSATSVTSPISKSQ